MSQETTAHDLPVTGKLPDDLRGRYLRNGPNPRNPNDHWFTGDGMVHGVRIADGTAHWYRNRYVHTESFDDPFPLYDQDGHRNLHASVANTHVVRHAHKILALVESSLPYEISPELDTVGCFDFGDRLDNSMTAHPKICPSTGELHFFGYGSLREPFVRYHRADAEGNLVLDQPIDVPGLTMMHDFALTANHVVFLDLPVVFQLDLARSGTGMPFRWQPEYGARLGVLARDNPTSPVQWFDIDPCYVFHVANAHEHDGRITLTAARYPSMWQSAGFDTDAVLWEWTLDLATGRANERQLDDVASEFPRIDDRLTGLRAGIGYLVTPDSVLRYDLTTGVSTAHQFDGKPGEATFVPRAGGTTELDGYLLTYVYRPSTDTSDLVVLDAADVAAAPIATVHLPVRVPNGFHGNWFSD